jgi:hypothetical protein
MTDANRKYNGGLGFNLWTDRGAWFWRLFSHRCGISTIGSASTENEALGDAQAAAEELSERCAMTGQGRVNSIGEHNLGLSITGGENSAAKPGNNTGDY